MCIFKLEVSKESFLILYVIFVIRFGKLYHDGFPELPFHRPGGYKCFPLLGGLVLGDLVTLARA
jgi:hypothetical protein